MDNLWRIGLISPKKWRIHFTMYLSHPASCRVFLCPAEAPSPAPLPGYGGETSPCWQYRSTGISDRQASIPTGVVLGDILPKLVDTGFCRIRTTSPAIVRGVSCPQAPENALS